MTEKFDVQVEITITDVSGATPVRYARHSGESFGCSRPAMHGIETAVIQSLLALGDQAIQLRAAAAAQSDSGVTVSKR